MKIDQIEIFHIAMPLVEPFETSFGTETERECLIVALYSDGLRGWGESPVSRNPGYSYETCGTAWHVAGEFIVPTLLEAEIESPADVGSLLRSIRGHPIAKAGFEAAFWDLQGKATGRSLREMFGGAVDRVAVGVSVGLQESPPALVARVERYVAAGYRRVKIKIKPGRDVEDVRAVRGAFPDLRLQVDANSAYRLDASEPIKALDDLGLLLIEQPLSEDDIVDHARLQEELATDLCLDESIVSAAHARWALDTVACRVINIKPSRVGGFSEATAIHDLCAERDVPVWCGGMLETGIGRAGNLALATLPNFRLPGDISATERYYTDDIITAKFTLNGDSTIDVPTSPGVGVEVDEERLQSVTVRRDSFRTYVQKAIGFRG
ncbi:MAG: o-succinylbenzoate synthase [Phycisphaerae bacterium]